MTADSQDKPAPYALIVEHFREQIETGALAPGDRLPPVREIATVWRVARQTADKALARLQAEGLIRTSGRGGTIVVDRADDLRVSISGDGMSLAVAGILGAENLVVQSANLTNADADIAREYGLPVGERVMIVQLGSSSGTQGS